MNPEKIYRVSEKQLSIARYYGGCIYNGDTYIYNPEDDTLTRMDLLKKKPKKKIVALSQTEWDDQKELFSKENE